MLLLVALAFADSPDAASIWGAPPDASASEAATSTHAQTTVSTPTVATPAPVVAPAEPVWGGTEWTVPTAPAPVVAPVAAPTASAAAAPVATASAATLRERPSRGKSPAAAYGNVDFTAYTLERGEAKVGIGQVAVGVAPRVQIGTSPVLDVLRVANVSAKANPVRLRGFDLGVGGSGYWFPGETMTASYARVAGTASQRLTEGWSVHGGASWALLTLDGTPNLDPLAPWFQAFAGWRPSEDTIAEAEEGLYVAGKAQSVTLKVATDLRFNRRDSVILQAEGVVWGHSDLPVDVPASLTGGTPVAAQSSGGVNPLDAYVASVAYQASFRNVNLRVGVGTSTLPGAWLLQSTELSARFGGPTRKAERAAVRAWKAERVASTRPTAVAVADASAPSPGPAAVTDGR